MALTVVHPDGPVDQVGDDERFQVHSQMEIVGLLRDVAAHREIVTVQFGGADGFVVSAVLGVDQTQDLVVLDYGADEAAMQRLLRATRLRVTTQLDHVRIAFAAEAALAATFEGGPAFCVPVPTSVLRMQRRDAYRLKLPMGRKLLCEMPVPGEPGRRRAVRVRDISVAGVGLVDVPKDVALLPGTIYPGCRIDLPELGLLVLDVEIMHSQEGDTRRCGCRFRNPPQSAATQIQRYISKIEREQHAVR